MELEDYNHHAKKVHELIAENTRKYPNIAGGHDSMELTKSTKKSTFKYFLGTFRYFTVPKSTLNGTWNI